ncbi:hypothetical protein N2K86_20895 [Enterobacter mori]|uniref:hypothetical protein n=1 Tax=Enterobacter mori TaxID=539813 RepID=UPI0021B0D5B1|nr:hypothetical protein [Enterobacter mori]UWX93069.1 hypothetical protein N2K86_20895 [Enterobacter mori]
MGILSTTPARGGRRHEGLPVQGAPPPAVVPVLVQQVVALLPGTESRFAVVLYWAEQVVKNALVYWTERMWGIKIKTGNI